MRLFCVTLLMLLQSIAILDARKGAPINIRKLPYDAPNAVIALYNNFVDNYLARLEVEIAKTADPIEFLIHGTPEGPVMVPAHLSVRPFRRPGQGLGKAYEPKLVRVMTSEDDEAEPASPPSLNWRLLDLLPSFTLLSPLESSREPHNNREDDTGTEKANKDEKKESIKLRPVESEEDSEEESNLEELAKNLTKAKSSSSSSSSIKGRRKEVEESQEYDFPALAYSSDESGEEAEEPFTNAVMTGLKRFQRSGDVNVQLTARDAVIMANLMLGPIEFTLNASADPQKRDILATIDELEAELRFTERHGMASLVDLRLDQVYSQDVNVAFNKKFLRKEDLPEYARERLYAKMAAQVSLEVVNLLRDKNLRDKLTEAADKAFNGFVVPYFNKF